MALQIRRSALEQVLNHAKQDHPIEACGLIAAKEGSLVAERVLPMQNRAASEVFYQFDSREQFQVYRRLDEDDQECCVIYHSHTASQAFPSKDDIDFAGHPELHYLIVSTWDQATVPVRSFRIIDGGVTEETIVIV
ncbi:M67 family metallopeptidase [Alcaligenes sp. A-TC2]|jgi:proteasome lid subunit RPN8/RPN11|uniref:M67 family metallopeptidase n=1 Tax=Alcaligenes faecalis TaxID=511 RepID=A0AAE9KN32_ALCFA|nr:MULTISPECIES: M67 family metallopeptidase [Alcaligenes]EKU31625.1 Mov34/MPN/PAD-1 family protein [Alcaligenes sp. HPC1271]ERI34640.1 peptidase [Alcaligenes sp. EGD-AK7]KGP03257.1 peptidase [Alcaligenes faecalis]MCX5472486.1 M67 family metallopeptidase [Alcaligenes nematophilus]MDK7586328.1 M67 family metallopeptidase [Alcaligenes phenolicus]